MAACSALSAQGDAIPKSMSSPCSERAGSIAVCRLMGEAVELKWVSSLAMEDPRLLRASAMTIPRPLATSSKSQASKDQLWQEFFSDPSQWWDKSFEKKSPRLPDCRHKRTNEVLWIDRVSNPPWVKAELSAMIDGQAQSVDGPNLDVRYEAPRGERSRKAQINQEQFLETGTSSMVTTSFQRGPRDNVNANSSRNMRTLCKAGQLKEALQILNQRGISTDSNTYLCLLQESIKTKDLVAGKEVHAHILLNGFKPSIVLLNTLINMYAKCGSVVGAREVFDRMRERTLFTWSIMIAGYAKHGCGQEAFELYEQMQWEGLTPDRVTFISILNACASLGVMEKGKEVHADIVKAGIVPDIILATALADMYTKCGSIKDANEVFNNMAERNVVSWSAMIAGYAQHGCGREAFKMYEQMLQEGVTPNRVTFICILQACASLGALEKGREVHMEIMRSGVVPDLLLENTLVDMYAKCGSIKDARQLFDNMAKRSVFTWNAMIAGNTRHGCGEEALEMYEQMIGEGVMPDRVTFIFVLNACASLGALEKGKDVHVDIIKARLTPYINLENALVNMYAKCGSMKDAHQVFDSMAQRDVVSWSIMIGGYAQHGYDSEAFGMYKDMIQEEVSPDKVTFICVLSACASPGALEKGKEVHADIIKSGTVPDINLLTALADMYAKCGSVKDARQVFDTMVQQNVVSWNAMISRYVQHGCSGEALEMYEEMQGEGITPDRVTFICVLRACASLGVLKTGEKVRDDILKAGFLPDIILETALADMYAKCGRVTVAREVFESMAERNVVSWNAMITGYAQQGCGREAFQMYEQMQREGVRPNSITFICVLHACSSLADLEMGKEVHANIFQAGIAPDISLETALVNMYAKCGSLTDAYQVFDKMSQRNVVSWNAMITGYAGHGCGREALQVFEEMQLEGVKPDSVTFICLLSACRQVGLVDEGRRYFDSMNQDHGLTPTVEHFSCMVDLLGRAGNLKEAQEFINQMPLKPDAGVWRALLGASRVHGNMELAELAAKRLFRLRQGSEKIKKNDVGQGSEGTQGCTAALRLTSLQSV